MCNYFNIFNIISDHTQQQNQNRTVMLTKINVTGQADVLYILHVQCQNQTNIVKATINDTQEYIKS